MGIVMNAKFLYSTGLDTAKPVKHVLMAMITIVFGSESASVRKICGSSRNSYVLYLSRSFMPLFYPFRAPKYKK